MISGCAEKAPTVTDDRSLSFSSIRQPVRPVAQRARRFLGHRDKDDHRRLNISHERGQIRYRHRLPQVKDRPAQAA